MAKNIMRSFKIDEISAVDRPAQAHARAVIMKRDDTVEIDEEELAKLIDAEIEKRAIDAYIARNYLAEIEKRDFTAEQRQTAARSGAAMPDGSFPIENGGDLKNAMRAIGRAKDPAKAKAHIRARAKALGLASELSDAFKSEGGVLAKLLAAIDAMRADVSKAVTTGIVVDPVTPTDKESDMTPAVKKALGLAETATEDDVLKALAKRDAELIIAKMTAEERTHYDALKADDEKDKFRGKSKEDRAKEMKDKEDKDKAEKAADPVLKKLETENDAMRKRLAALEEKDQKEAFAKRAEDMRLPAEKGETLRKAYAGDKTALDEIVGLLGKAYAAVEGGELLKELGTSLGGGLKSDDAHEQLLAKAAELRKADPKLTQEQAYAKVYSDPANRDIVKAERRANRPNAA